MLIWRGQTRAINAAWPLIPTHWRCIVTTKYSTDISAERLREVLHYCPETGLFTRTDSRGGRYSGSVSGNVRKDGYIGILIDNRRYLAHRLAWLYVHGAFPAGEIDHADGVRSNNAMTNLREATRSENVHNRKGANKNNRCGFLGVSWSKQRSKWVAQIRLARKSFRLGFFDNPEAAHAAYLSAKSRLHPFSNHLKNSQSQ